MIRAKKSLGQNFLVDRNILEKIVNVTQIKHKTILEDKKFISKRIFEVEDFCNSAL